MSRTSKALAGATAIATGPSGLRRLAGGCLVVALLLGLGLAGLLAFAAWSARNSEGGLLPCPPGTVAVAWSTDAAPGAARKAVDQALTAAGRKPVGGGWGTGKDRDLVVVWSPGAATRMGAGEPARLILGQTPTTAEVRSALGARLAPCETAPSPSATAAPVEPQGPGEEAGGLSWPWERRLGTSGLLGLGIGLWWLAGPNLARVLWRVLWPLRLTWRRMQRATYRRRLRRGQWPAEWPLLVSAGQRWHESAAAMHDRQGFRAQIAEGEPERKASLRDEIRASLTGQRGSWASVMRLAYRVPAHKGAPEREGVSQ